MGENPLAENREAMAELDRELFAIREGGVTVRDRRRWRDVRP